jgi:hypothetical protein
MRMQESSAEEYALIMDIRSRNKLRYNEREVEEEDGGFSLHTAE